MGFQPYRKNQSRGKRNCAQAQRYGAPIGQNTTKSETQSCFQSQINHFLELRSINHSTQHNYISPPPNLLPPSLPPHSLPPFEPESLSKWPSSLDRSPFLSPLPIFNLSASPQSNDNMSTEQVECNLGAAGVCI